MDQFSPKHFIFLMFAVGIVSLKTYPIIFIENSGRDSWVALIVASVLTACYFLFVVVTVKSAGNTSLLALYQTAFGKIAGGFFMILFSLAAFLTLVESASIEADSMHQNMMVETPHWYFLLFFVLPALYIVRKDLVAVITISIIGITLITLAGIHLGILTMLQKEVRNLFPVFEHGVTPGFWISVLKSFGLYGFLSLTLPYIPQIQYKREKMLKYVLLALLFIIQMQIVSITGVFMTFSPAGSASYYYPKLIQTHLVSYFEMLEFGELYVMLQILGGWLLKYVVTFHSIMQVMKSFHFQKRTVNIVSYLLTALVLAAADYLTYTSIRLFAALEYLPWISLVCFILIPLAACILYWFKKGKSTSAVPAPAPGPGRQ